MMSSVVNNKTLEGKMNKEKDRNENPTVGFM